MISLLWPYGLSSLPSHAYWLPATLAFSVSWTSQTHFCWAPLTWLFPLPGCLDMLALDMGQVTAWMSSSERPLLTTLLKGACFPLTQSLSHHPVGLPEIILFISSLIYNSENELYGRRDLLSLSHCFKLRTSIRPISACFGGELMN